MANKVFLFQTNEHCNWNTRCAEDYKSRTIGSEFEISQAGDAIKFLDKLGREIVVKDLIGKKMQVIG